MPKNCWLPCLLWLSAAAHGLELKSPDRAPLDTDVAVIVSGADPKSFVSIVAPQTPEGQYDRYQYARTGTISVPAPATVGTFEVRLLAAERPYATLARRPIEIHLPETHLDAPASVAIGTEFDVQWRGPSASREFISLVPVAMPDGEYADYKYVRGDGAGAVKLTTPAQPGAYELRYMTGSKRVVIGRRPLQVGDVAASVRFAPSIGMGAKLSVEWSGPGHPRDFITIVSPDAALRDYGDYEYATQSPLLISVPETAGVYEVRYLTADSERILARGPLTVTAVSASVQAADSVEAGSEVAVNWNGPNNDLDYIAITEVGDPKAHLKYTYTKRGNPLIVLAPKQAGDYELHYLTGRDDVSLARRAIKVTPGPELGTLKVIGKGADAAGSAATSIELILDASGSMLQKLGGQRRIDIARNVLDQLVQRDIAPGTPVALRVFGHQKADACDTERVVALAPLDRASLGATLRAIEAKNLAKTPIAASLAAVAGDLAGVEGQALVILVTDGEETCNGDPVAEIARLRQSGFQVALNVVGFAVDEYALEQEFARWAELGGGAYFSAGNAETLARSVRQAIRPPYGVYAGAQRVASGVVGGDAVSLKAGSYEVHVGDRRLPVTILPESESLVEQ